MTTPGGGRDHPSASTISVRTPSLHGPPASDARFSIPIHIPSTTRMTPPLPCCHTTIHLLPQAAEGAEGARLAVGGELVARVWPPLLLCTHREAEAALVAADHEGASPACVVLALFPDREVAFPAFSSTSHAIAPPWARRSWLARTESSRRRYRAVDAYDSSARFTSVSASQPGRKASRSLV